MVTLSAGCLCWRTRFHLLSVPPISRIPTSPWGGNRLLVSFEAQPTTKQEEARPSFKGLRETRAVGQSLGSPMGIWLQQDPAMAGTPGCWPLAHGPLGHPRCPKQIAQQFISHEDSSSRIATSGSFGGSPGTKVLLEKNGLLEKWILTLRHVRCLITGVASPSQSPAGHFGYMTSPDPPQALTYRPTPLTLCTGETEARRHSS